MPAFLYNIFAYPAAWLTAVFHGAGVQRGPDGQLWIPLAACPMHVTPSCSGAGFFAFLCVYALVFILRCGAPSRTGKAVLLAVPAAYLTTVLANATRMTCAYHVARLSRMLLPLCFQPVIHMAVGIAVFLSVLILCHFLLERICCYGSR